MRFILRYLKPFYAWMALGLLIKATGSIVELALPYILSHILDNIAPLGSVRLILIWGGIMLLCAALALIFNVVANRMAARVARDASRVIRHDLFRKTMYLSAGQVDRITVPSLESRLTSDTYNVHHFIGLMQRLGVRAPLLMIGGLVISWLLDRTLTLTMLAVLPLVGLAIFLISKRGIPLYTDIQSSTDNMIRIVREDSQGIRVIKALSRTEDEKNRFDQANHALVRSEKRAGYTMALSNPIITLLLNIGLVAVVITGAYLVDADMSQPGRIIGFIQYFTLISNAMLAVTRLFVQYSKGVASANRIKEILDLQPELQPESEDACPTPDYVPGDGLYFDDVSFSYNGVRNNIDHLTFHVPSGSSLGIIGATGSGKSTIVQLMLRLYDPDSGGIYLNGKNIRTLTGEELYRTYGAVLQNGFIYNDTITENICFGREFSEEEVRSAAKTAQAEAFIDAEPEGFDRVLTFKGTNISGGQRQRILLARAIVAKPDILIMDDSSSALDYKTDANLRQAVKSDLQGKTVVTIAQRVSSVKSCSSILVLDEGKVIGLGTHEELMADCPAYREISQSQMGGDFFE